MENAFPKHEELISSMFDVLNEEELTTLTELLKK